MNYGEVKTLFQDLFIRTDISDSQINTCLTLAHQRLSRELRTPEMEVLASLAADAQGRLAVPADFLELRELFQGEDSFVRSDASEFRRLTLPSGYTPRLFIRQGGFWHVKPVLAEAETVDILYYAKPAALSANGDTNVFTDHAADLLAYAGLVHAADMFLDERKAEFDGVYQGLLAGLNANGIAQEFGGGHLAVRPLYEGPY